MINEYIIFHFCTFHFHHCRLYYKATATTTETFNSSTGPNIQQMFQATRTSHCEKSWPTSCSTLVSSTQWTIIANNRSECRTPFTTADVIGRARFTTADVIGRAQFTTAVVRCQVEQEAILIFAHILYLKPEYLPGGASREDLNVSTESGCQLSNSVP